MFMALVSQRGGCDYTIRCGADWLELPNATNMEEAKAELWQVLIDEYGFGYVDAEIELNEVVILEVSNKEVINHVGWNKAADDLRRSEEAEEKKQEELAMLARLKSQYEQ